MPKKKPVTFPNSIPGKFIPRNVSSGFPSGANSNRFNAKMAELFASSSIINDENELVSTTSSEDHSTSTELISNDSSCIHSKLFHRRMVTMIETLKKPHSDLSTLPLTSLHSEQKSQPITFGQLRQATISSTSAIVSEVKSVSQSVTTDTEDKPQKTSPSFVRDHTSDLTSETIKSSTRNQTNRERLYYSPSLEQLFEEQNAVSQTKKEEEQQPQNSSLTVDELLAMHYSKVKAPTNTESHVPPSAYSHTTTGFYMHPSVPRWNLSQSNPPIIPPRLIFNEQNRTRPPPPSYSSSVANDQRLSSAVVNPDQHLIRSSVSPLMFECFYPGLSTTQQLIPANVSIILPNSSTSYAPALTNLISNNSVRPPPPQYQTSISNVTRSHSTLLSIDQSSTSNPQSKNNNPVTGFDREFSRLLYGKDAETTRRKKPRRKAFSDPVKKSVEEAGRSSEKTYRRVTTHLNKTKTMEDDDDDGDDDEIQSNRSTNHKQECHSLPRRRFPRQSHLMGKTSESTRKAIIPANPVLKRRIPSFLRVYSQASPSTDVLLQWHLFNLSELESFYTMITRLYKNENLARVQLYETYRAALISVLASKPSSTTDDENDAATTAL